jgi:hypothetical protein
MFLVPLRSASPFGFCDRIADSDREAGAPPRMGFGRLALFFAHPMVRRSLRLLDEYAAQLAQ